MFKYNDDELLFVPCYVTLLTTVIVFKYINQEIINISLCIGSVVQSFYTYCIFLSSQRDAYRELYKSYCM